MHSSARMCAAVIGGSAVITLGALGSGIAERQDAPTPVAAPHMTLGSTSTVTLAPDAPDLGVAAPTITGPAPLPTEEQGLEGIEGRHH
jgi:hypothetical protein